MMSDSFKTAVRTMTEQHVEPSVPENAESAKERVARHWSEMVVSEQTMTHWMDSPIISGHLDGMATGDPSIGWLDYACRKYVMHDGKGVARGLSLGCGSGNLERPVRRMGACETIDAYDLAPGAIETAKRLAAEEGLTGINYEVRDLEHTEFPENHYDVVFICSAVHHFSQLEAVFARINSCLKPGGIFITHEFVGPSQFQWTAKQMQIINELLTVMPARYRKLSTAPGELKVSVGVPTIEEMNRVDPSEAIRSAEIIPLMEKMFEIVEKRELGGAVLHLLLHNIIQNVDDGSETGEAYLRLLIYLETVLTREKVLDTDWAFLVARAKKS